MFLVMYVSFCPQNTLLRLQVFQQVRVRIEVEEASVDGGGARKLVMTLAIGEAEQQKVNTPIGSGKKEAVCDAKRKRAELEQHVEDREDEVAAKTPTSTSGNKSSKKKLRR
jgi:hypothetical protein